MTYHISYLWEQGARPVNEDSLAVLSLSFNSTSLLFAAVADGIGGLPMGQDASSSLLYRLKFCLEQRLRSPGKISLSRLKRLMLKELYRSHRHMTDYGKDNSISLGSTVSMVLILGKRGVLIHCGDSRVYKNKRILTKDQTISPRKLKGCIGAGSYKRPFCRRFHLSKKDELSLCTDGYYLNDEKDNRTLVLIKAS